MSWVGKSKPAAFHPPSTPPAGQENQTRKERIVIGGAIGVCLAFMVMAIVGKAAWWLMSPCVPPRCGNCGCWVGENWDCARCVRQHGFPWSPK